MNLVSLIMKFLTPEMIAKISSALGVDRTLIEKGIAAAVPALLGGLSGAVSKPGGADALASAIGKQDSGLLGNLAGMLGGPGQADLVNNGTSVLGSLLGGGSSVTGLAGALGKFTGLGNNAGSLIGLLAPVVLGTLGQQQKASGLDAGGLAKLLGDQKDNISAAMPAGFGDVLKASGLGDQFGGVAKMATAAMASGGKAAGAAAGAATGAAAAAASQARGGMSWLPWVIGLILLGALGWYFFAPGKSHLIVSGTEISTQSKSIIGSAMTTLATVRDAASAKAALPTLNDAADKLGKLQSGLSALPADAKKAVAAVVAPELGKLTPMLDSVMKIPGVGDVLKPWVDKVKPILDALAKG